MRNKFILKFLVFALVFCGIAYAVLHYKLTTGQCQNIANRLQQAAKHELKSGAKAETIEEFLTHHGVLFTFDSISGRYQGVVRISENPPGIDCAVVGYIYVGQSKEYVRSEFIPTYTGL